MQPQWRTYCNSVSHAGLWFVGSNYYNFTEIFYSLDKIMNPRSCNAIVICYKDDRSLFGHFLMRGCTMCLFFNRSSLFRLCHKDGKSADNFWMCQRISAQKNNGLSKPVFGRQTLVLHGVCVSLRIIHIPELCHFSPVIEFPFHRPMCLQRFSRNQSTAFVISFCN